MCLVSRPVPHLIPATRSSLQHEHEHEVEVHEHHEVPVDPRGAGEAVRSHQMLNAFNIWVIHAGAGEVVVQIRHA